MKRSGLGLLLLSLCALLLYAGPVKLTEAQWHGTGCYKIEMTTGTVYFEKDTGGGVAAAFFLFVIVGSFF